MELRTLGSGAASLRVSAQGFGCMGITAFYGRPIPDEDAVALLCRAAELGVTHWDTAEAYQVRLEDGSTAFNETVVGRAIAAVGRAKLTIATKYAPSLHGNTLIAEQAVEAARAACERLGVDCVDLYYVHRFAGGTPVAQQAEAMNAVKAAGLAKHIGVSEFSPRNLSAFHAVCPVTCVQQEWSLLNRDLEEELVPLCRRLGVGVVAYSPLCRSLLSGAVRSAADLPNSAGAEDLRPRRYGKLAAGNLEKNAVLVEAVTAMAATHGASTSQLSLAWVGHQGDDVVTIPGTTKMKHLEENVAAQALALSPAQLEALAAAVPQDRVAGDRFTGGVKGTFHEQDL